MLIKSKVDAVTVLRTAVEREMFYSDLRPVMEPSRSCNIVVEFTLFDNYPTGHNAGEQLSRRTISQLLALNKKPVAALDRPPIIEPYTLQSHGFKGLAPSAVSGVVISLDRPESMSHLNGRITVDDVLRLGTYRFKGTYRQFYHETALDQDRTFMPDADGVFPYTIVPGGTTAPDGSFVTITHFGVVSL